MKCFPPSDRNSRACRIKSQAAKRTRKQAPGGLQTYLQVCTHGRIPNQSLQDIVHKTTIMGQSKTAWWLDSSIIPQWECFLGTCKLIVTSFYSWLEALTWILCCQLMKPCRTQRRGGFMTGMERMAYVSTRVEAVGVVLELRIYSHSKSSHSSAPALSSWEQCAQ